MDFDEIDLRAFLKASLPGHFQDLNPYDFERFMAWLFRQDGYDVEETSYSGDFGADLLLTKAGKRTVVQVKRYAPGTHVGVSDINQVIGAATYYDADGALMITTSDFTTSALTLAKSADVILWNWDRLVRYLSNVLLDGEDPAQASESDLTETTEAAPEDWFNLDLLEVIPDQFIEGDIPAIGVRLTLENTSGKNLTIHLDLPVVVSRKTRRQVHAAAWKPKYFFHGMIVSESTVELSCYFLLDQIPEIRAGDRMLLRMHIGGHEPVLIDEVLRAPKSACYVITHVYGRESEEYTLMILFRDRILMRSALGRALVSAYYRQSPKLVSLAHERQWIAGVLRFIVICVVWLLQMAISGKPSKS